MYSIKLIKLNNVFFFLLIYIYGCLCKEAGKTMRNSCKNKKYANVSRRWGTWIVNACRFRDECLLWTGNEQGMQVNLNVFWYKVFMWVEVMLCIKTEVVFVCLSEVAKSDRPWQAEVLATSVHNDRAGGRPTVDLTHIKKSQQSSFIWGNYTLRQYKN